MVKNIFGSGGSWKKNLFQFYENHEKKISIKHFSGVYIHNTDWSRGKTSIDTTKFPPSSGVTYELCAGIIDKDLPIAEIAQQEVLEETGYLVSPNDLERVTSMRYN